MKDYLFLLCSALFNAVSFSFNKIYQKKRGIALSSSSKYTCVMGVVIAVIFWAINGFAFNITPYSICIALGMAMLSDGYTILQFRILKYGAIAEFTLFLMMGGMIVPYIWGLCFLGEAFSLLQSFGLLVICAAMFVSNANKERRKPEVTVMLIIVFILNGFMSVLSKVHQVETRFECVNTVELVMLTGVCRALVSFIVHLFARKKHTTIAPIRKDIHIVFGAAAAMGLAYFLNFNGSLSVPATVVFPIITGGTVIFSALSGAVVFKEKISRNIVISIALSFVGTLLFL